MVDITGLDKVEVLYTLCNAIARPIIHPFPVSYQYCLKIFEESKNKYFGEIDGKKLDIDLSGNSFDSKKYDYHNNIDKLASANDIIKLFRSTDPEEISNIKYRLQTRFKRCYIDGIFGYYDLFVVHPKNPDIISNEFQSVWSLKEDNNTISSIKSYPKDELELKLITSLIQVDWPDKFPRDEIYVIYDSQGNNLDYKGDILGYVTAESDIEKVYNFLSTDSKIDISSFKYYKSKRMDI